MTNRNRRFVKLPPKYVQRCLGYGQRIVDHYANGGSPASRSRSGDRGTESNVTLQAQGKVGECALAICLGIDPDTAVKWDTDFADGGTDIYVPTNGARIDVKTTLPPFKLIWSRNVNDLYHQKKFDIIVAASVEEGDLSRCYLEGWITKGSFFLRKQIADGVNSKLEHGTWFVDKSILSNIDDLLYLPILTGTRIREDA